MAARKVLVTGASGLLGRELLQRFQREGWECMGLAFSRAREGLVRVNLHERADVEATVDSFSPQVIVHSAAERRPDVLSKKEEEGKALNVGATELLTEVCRQRGIFLLYISTDYVFDGSSAPYATDAVTNPINAYGTSKRDGELAVCKYSSSAVLRIPVLYGPVEALSESAVTTIFSAVLDSSKPSKQSHYERRYPTHIRDVASVSECLCSRQLEEPGCATGIWHCSGDDCLTKYAMACEMAELFSLPTSHLQPSMEPSAGAPRPYDCRLDCASTRAAFPTAVTSFRTGIRDILEPFLPGKGRGML